jgi:hypothetical protein
MRAPVTGNVRRLMTPHQALALGVRLFVIWTALSMARELAALLNSRHMLDDTSMLTLFVGWYVLLTLVLLVLWFFPKSIARGLLPAAGDAATPALSYQMWFTLGIMLLGLWFAVSAVTPLLRNLSVLFVFRPELINSEEVRTLRVGTLYYVAELVLGLCLVFGATGIRKLILWVRHAGPG